ncbi:MAG: ABC transporter ATP-binding protein, partial [Parafannyhessea sp.]|uniref:ABC transporter ATP-binding protein n=1 Tax=Parafannyhessea sp. TaxID=2847324 RepID=UPI003EFC7FD4
DDERELGYQRVQEQYRAQLKNVELDAISSVFQNLADTASNAIILVYGGYLVATGGLQLASLIAFFSYVSQGSFVNSAENIVLYYQNIKMGLGACATIMEVAKTPDERVKTGKSFTVPEADITFDDVTFGYDPEDPVLRDVSFTIPSGKTTAIVGSNSSGKTTVLRLLERFYGPDKGTISYGGEKIDDFDLDEWRDSMGYVVQNSPLVKGTVELNICYGMEKPDHDLAVQAAKEADAYDFVMGMDNGFDSQIGELGGGISGGQRQKLGIARAIVRHPEMMLLDEATTGLDATSIVEIDKTLEHTLRGKTVVKVAHRLDEIEDSDQVVFLDHGRVRGVGPHDELLRDNEDYRRFCGFAS